MTRPVRSIAIIGAGAGGLAAARRLMQDGHDVTLFEAGSHVGGLWVYDNDNGLSVAYESLHINSEPRITSLPGYPFKPGTPTFPGHRHVASYLHDFSVEHGIYERVRFRSPVAQVEPAENRPGSGWDVTLADGTREHFDDVVVASGHQGVPADPDWAQNFDGDYLHSHGYRTPARFTGKRVLVVGVGNSGLDIAADLAPFASKTYSSARSPVLIMPRMILGVPSARIIVGLGRPWLPWIVQRQLMRGISRVYHGRMEQWGLRTPKTRTHPASNATYMAHVSYQNITVVPGITTVDGAQVSFTDGSTVEVDTIIAATGYHLDLPFLSPRVSPIVERRLDAYKRIVHPDWPGLYFVGFFNVSGGANISLMDVQANFLANVVTGRVALPSPREMHVDIEAELARSRKRFPSAPRYGLELEPRHYRQQLAKVPRPFAGGRS